MQHFQALVRLDTSSPPGNEVRAVEYLKQVLEKEGIPVQVFAKDPQRPNLVARIKGNGRKRPLLVMGHTDVVTVDPAKWTHPPFARRARRRIRLWPRHRGRQGQPGREPDAGPHAEAHRRGPRSRRHLHGRIRRGRRARGRRAVHGGQPSRRHQRRVLPRRRRRPRPHGRAGAARQRRDHREGAAPDRAHRPRPRRPRLRAIAQQRRHAAERRGGPRRQLDAAPAPQRNDGDLLPQARRDVAARCRREGTATC